MESDGRAHLLLDQPTSHVGLSGSHSQLNQRSTLKFTDLTWKEIYVPHMLQRFHCSPRCCLYLDGTDNAHAQMLHCVLQIKWTVCQKNGKLLTPLSCWQQFSSCQLFKIQKTSNPFHSVFFTFGKKQQSISSEFSWFGLQKKHRVNPCDVIWILKKGLWSDFTNDFVRGFDPAFEEPCGSRPGSCAELPIVCKWPVRKCFGNCRQRDERANENRWWCGWNLQWKSAGLPTYFLDVLAIHFVIVLVSPIGCFCADFCFVCVAPAGYGLSVRIGTPLESHFCNIPWFSLGYIFNGFLSFFYSSSS